MINVEEGEQIISVVRRHYLVLLPMVLIVILGAIAPYLIYKFLMSGFLPFDPGLKDVVSKFVQEWEVFSYSLWLLMLWVFFFIEWTDYYLDFWVITNKRILDVEQKRFFHRDVTSFRYSDIQDITVETRGVVETFFRFGTLHIQTSGHNRQILIKDAYDPEGAKNLILNMQEKYKRAI